MESKIAKFTGSIEAEAALDRMVRAANDGFSGGRVTRHDLVSWMFHYFEKQCFQGCIERIRQDHFDQVAYLESVLKQAKQARRSGTAAPDLAELLSPLNKPSKSERGKNRQLQLDEKAPSA
jgi:hypothetical protein